MNFEFDAGMAFTAVAALIFYLRIAMIRGKKRRLAREETAEMMRQAKNKYSKKKTKVDDSLRNKPSIEVASWAVIIIAIVLMLVGLIARNSPNMNIPELAVQYWWVGTTVGFILFAFGFK